MNSNKEACDLGLAMDCISSGSPFFLSEEDSGGFGRVANKNQVAFLQATLPHGYSIVFCWMEEAIKVVVCPFYSATGMALWMVEIDDITISLSLMERCVAGLLKDPETRINQS